MSIRPIASGVYLPDDLVRIEKSAKKKKKSTGQTPDGGFQASPPDMGYICFERRF